MKNFYLLLFACFFMNTEAQIINFPDANLKTKLLASSSTSIIAKDSDGENVAIDSNSDGEIEVSEALNIAQLYLAGTTSGSVTDISDLTGIEYFTNLKALNCQMNNISTLNVSALSQLQYLYCQDNNLASLNVSGLANLKVLHCHINSLSNLVLTGLSSLENLLADNNNLTSLDLTPVASLQTASVRFNSMASLSVTGLGNLTILNCSHNELATLSLSGLSSLTHLHIGDNLFSIVDANSLSSLTTLTCNNNPYLTKLFLKNGAVQNSLILNNSPQLNYICADPAEISSFQATVNTLGYNAEINSYCTLTPGGNYFTAYGSSRYDADGNGCGVSDPAIPNLNLFVSNGISSTNVIANSLGNYYFDVPAGSYTVAPVLPNAAYFSISPATYIVAFPVQSNPHQQDFCITPNGVHPNLEVTIIPLTEARPGFTSNYKIVCRNKGTEIQSGTITFEYEDPFMDLIYASPVADVYGPGILTWNYADFLPFEIREYTVSVEINSPTDTPAVNQGDQLDFVAIINPITGDEVPADNTHSLKQDVVNSFDPNDKTCLQGNTVGPEMVGDYVHYLIRFENTGTHPAQNIVVKDMIETSKFQVSSLIPISASHPFETRISATNKVEFIFENIMLPFDDENNDGYVAFKIKTLPSLQVGDSFSNNASIYFDYNFPIVTNTATTTITALATNDFDQTSSFTLYPNPSSDRLNIYSIGEIPIKAVNIYNLVGQKVMTSTGDYAATIDVSSMAAGHYIVKITSDHGTSTCKFVKN